MTVPSGSSPDSAAKRLPINCQPQMFDSNVQIGEDEVTSLLDGQVDLAIRQVLAAT